MNEIEALTALADDELILAQRDGEWIGHAPILEEDIAIANLAQDELGHAMLWLELRKELDGREPDELAFFRDPTEFRNAQFLELPNRDWAFTLLRHYLFDSYEVAWLPEVLEHPRLGPTAAKILREEHFHVTYSRSWVGRLAESAEGHRRLQQALEELWPLAQQLLAPGGFVDPDRLRQNWQLPVAQELQHMGLTLPLGPAFQPSDRRLHTEHLWSLLAELQSVARSDPEARVW